jgi:hypothetical protein
MLDSCPSLRSDISDAQNNPNMRVIIAGTENITMNLYNGNQRSMLITNCIFRLGGVALLLSNHPADRFKAKYKLKHMVRTHLGGVDEAYKYVHACRFLAFPLKAACDIYLLRCLVTIAALTCS